MADIFVSYSRQDKARVAPLVAALEAEGWSVWWDPEIAPGQDFDRQITKELDRLQALRVKIDTKLAAAPYPTKQSQFLSDIGRRDTDFDDLEE